MTVFAHISGNLVAIFMCAQHSSPYPMVIVKVHPDYRIVSASLKDFLKELVQ